MYYNNKRLALSVFWIVLGVALLALSIAGKLDPSLYAGMGGALACVGTFQVIRNLRYRKDTAYREKIDVELSDERNEYLRMKSWSLAGNIAVLIESIGIVVAMITGQETVQLVLSYSMCLLLVAYWAAFYILARKY
ncbi:MAG: hypothetical protein J6D34_00740 [Atopobiaceae bacterium]|nr:hypothetical protein [Atopobiaceae bacterium]